MEQSSIVTTHLSTRMEWQKNITHNINRCEKAMSLIVLQLVVTLIPVHKHENESIGLSSRYRRYSWPKHSLILLLSKPGDIYQFLSDSHQKAVFYYTEIQYYIDGDSWGCFKQEFTLMCHINVHVIKYVTVFKKYLWEGRCKENMKYCLSCKKTKQSQAIKEHHHFLKSLSCHITSVPD